MSLPVPNLDDRTFQDIVDEAKRLIPTYCPEWTNHNLTDPGVALIELFAWMTELSLFRLNQVPDAFYTHMLNLLGLRAVPGDGGPHRPHVLARRRRRRAGRRAGRHPGRHGRRRRRAARLHHARRPRHHPAELIASLVSPGPDAYVDVWDALRLANQAVVCFPRTPTTPGDRFYLGFERPLAGNAHPHDDRRQRRGHRRHPDQAAAALGGVAGRGLDPGHGVPRHHRRAQPQRQIVLLVPAGARAADARRPAGVLAAGPRARARARASRRTAPRRRSARSASTRSAAR